MMVITADVISGGLTIIVMADGVELFRLIISPRGKEFLEALGVNWGVIGRALAALGVNWG